jgi:hypothetical protein
MPSYSRTFAIERDYALGKLDAIGVVGSCFVDDRLQVLRKWWRGFQLLPDSNILISKMRPCPFHRYSTKYVMLKG